MRTPGLFTLGRAPGAGVEAVAMNSELEGRGRTALLEGECANFDGAIRGLDGRPVTWAGAGGLNVIGERADIGLC